MADKRLLICSAGIPHERDGASVVLFYHYIDRLKRDGYRIKHILLLPGQNWSERAVREYAAKMANGCEPSRFGVTAVRADRFYSEGLRHHRLAPAAADEVVTAACSFQPDIIVAFDLLAAWITGRVNAPRRLV